jgi:hypothetical protein
MKKKTMKYKFKNLKKPIHSSEFWYDIAYGGYLKPNQFSDDPETIKEIENAIILLGICEEMTGEE